MVQFSKTGNTSGEADFRKKDYEFSFGYVEFEVPVG